MGNSISSEQFKSDLKILRQVFETTPVDYLSRDSFANIERQLHRNVEQRSYQSHPREISSGKTPANQRTTTESNPVRPLIASTTTAVSNKTQLPPTTSVVGSSTNRTTSTNNVAPVGQSVSQCHINLISDNNALFDLF